MGVVHRDALWPYFPADTLTTVISGKARQSELEARLGYEFQQAALLAEALRHASARTSGGAVGQSGLDNERLEFLGDRVLGLAVAELVTETFPLLSEGELARRFNRLVRRETCADIARDLRLGAHLVLSPSEMGSGGRAKDNILADAAEAVLGAIFIDGGFEAARRVIRALWSSRLDGISSTSFRSDAKTTLQEWAQGQGLPLPDYEVAARDGPDHAPAFTSVVRVKDLEPATGSGTSKRFAEQAAAEALLLREQVWEKRHDG